MQKLIETLKSFGIEIPEDKKEEIKRSLSEHYKNAGEYDKVVKKMNEYKTSLDDVQTKLDGFKDVDVDDLKGQISTLTTQLNDEKAARAADAKKIEAEKTVNEFLSSTDEKGNKLYEFLNDITSDHYRDALVKALDDDSAKGKSISDIFKGMITDKDGNQKPGIFVDQQQRQAQQNAAHFTTAAGGKQPPAGQKYSMSELMRMKNENPNLDIKQYM